MRTVKVTILMILCLTGWGRANTTEMTDLSRPAILLAAEGRLFILEGTTIRIYDLEDFSLIKTFGRRGEGPSEFITQPYGPPMSMSVTNGRLAVNSMNKLSYFTLAGDFVRMVRTNPSMVFYPFRDKYITVGPALPSPYSLYPPHILSHPVYNPRRAFLLPYRGSGH